MENKRQIWSDASLPGLVVGLVPLAQMLLNSVAALVPFGWLSGLLGGLLWLAKLTAGIWLLRFFMRKFVSYTPGATNADTFRFGLVTSLYASIVIGAVNLIYALAFPEVFTTAMDAMKQSLDANSLQVLNDTFIPNLPVISFFANLVYGMIWGLFLSAVLSRNIPDGNPFNND